jgi:hypothetical protein
MWDAAGTQLLPSCFVLYLFATQTQAYGYDTRAWLVTLQQMILSLCKVLDLPTCGGNPFSLDLSQLK